MTTVGELRAAMNALNRIHDDAAVKAWLPGSTLTLENSARWSPRHGAVIIEANVDPGSALDVIVDGSAQIQAAAGDLLTAAAMARHQLGVYMIGHGTKGWSCACGVISVGNAYLPHKDGCVIAVLDAAIAKAGAPGFTPERGS